MADIRNIINTITEATEGLVEAGKEAYLRSNNIIQALEKTNPDEINAILKAGDDGAKDAFITSALDKNSTFGPNVLKIKAQNPEGFRSLADTIEVSSEDILTMSAAIQKQHNVNQYGVKPTNVAQQPKTDPIQTTSTPPKPTQDIEPDTQPTTEPVQNTSTPAPAQNIEPKVQLSALEAGREFIDRMVKGTDTDDNQTAAENVYSNGDYLKGDMDLMESIGDAINKNPGIESDLLLAKHGNSEAFSRVMENHPEVIRAVIPIAAAANPGDMGKNAMDAMGAKLKEGLTDKNGAIPDSMKDTAADIDKFVTDMKTNTYAMEYLGNQLSDIETSGRILDNIDSLTSSAGSPERMKMVMDDMAKNPTEVMDMMASPMMMAYAQQRYASDIIGKIDLNTSGIQQQLTDMADSEGAQKLKSLTGIDMKGMLGKLAKNLPGFETQVQGFMQHYGAQLSMNMLSFNATSSWMGGFGGGDMSMGGNMFENLMGSFKSFSAGMGISSYAQARMTDGTGHVRVKEYDNWVAGQKDMIANYRVDENTGSVTEVKQPEQVDNVDSNVQQPGLQESGATTYPLGEGPKGEDLVWEKIT